ncbi:gluconokinase [Anaerobacillus sp. MEB173]|uniref:gluconokinase n=1 Tax=Anaerobacillus sp. MEB173 TaxID=3383345 RepID=UPI003F93034A
MERKYVIGLDIGTTSAKAVLFQKDGIVISESETTYPVHSPYPSWVEQDPNEIERAAVQSLREVITKSNVPGSSILCVGISAAMHSLICMDENNHPLSPSITWADGRSVQQAKHLKNTIGTEIYLKTGTPIHPMSPLLKLLWMKETKYKPYVKAKKFISIKEFIFQKWFGSYIVDYSVASATGLFNIHRLEWDKEALILAGITAEQLSTPVSPTTVSQGLSTELANEIGLSKDTPFVIGASDGPLANLGIGAINPGEVALTIGTSGAIRQMATKPKTDSLQEIFCYAFTEDLWIMGGPTNNGAIVLQWLKDTLGQQEIHDAKEQGVNPYDLLTGLAAQSPAGANGLLFMPFLNGERAPVWNANARGSYVGLTLSHTKQDLLRAGLEGVILGLYSVGEALERLAGSHAKLFASGGFARSPLWLQIVADIFGTDVLVPESHQSSAWGAAWVGLYAINEVQSLADIKHHIPMKQTFTPDSNNNKTYQELYKIYRDLYQSLEPQFEALAEFQKKH